VFRVRTSIKSYRNNPAWSYEKSGRDYLEACDRTGYPFSYGTRGNDAFDLLRGSIGGREAALFHLVAWVPGGVAGTSKNGYQLSVAVLTLAQALPATAFCRPIGEVSEGSPALPPAAGPAHDLPAAGPGSRVRGWTADPDFAALIDTPQLRQLLQSQDLGWRIDGDRIIGWLPGRRTYEEMIAMGETLTGIVADFPADAWSHHPES
jgi:hypothetical protein